MPTRTVITRLVAEVGPYTAGMARASAATRAFASTATASAASASRGVTSGLAATAAAAGREGRATGLRYSQGLNTSLSTAGTGTAARVGASLRATEAPALAAGRRAGAAYGQGLNTSMRASAAAAGATFAKVMRTVGLGAAVGIGAIFAATIGAGFKRLNAIDQAKAKLSGLGHSAAEVQVIMDNALKSVKGTAFGLDEAATTAAAVVAAGIKPGKDLTQVLSTVADTATIAGTSMADMGAIFGSVAARGKLQGDDLLQLQSKGVPVLAMLAKHYHITAAAASDMVTAGTVDFRNFAAAMHENLGGAALKSGDTLMGAFKNMKAALGRLGADLLSGIFPKLQGGFTGLTTKIDDLGDSAKKAGELLGTGISISATILGTAFHGIAAVIGPVAKGFGALPGPLKAAATGMAALALANRLFGSKLAGTGASLTRFATGIRAIATTGPAVVRTTSGMAVSMGRFGSAIQQIGNRVPVIARMQGAFVNASTGAARFNRTIGLGRAAMVGLRSAGSGLLGFLGGPWGLALAGATVLLGAWAKHQQDAAQKAAEHKQQVEELTNAIQQDGNALGKQTAKQIAKNLVDSDTIDLAKEMGISQETLTRAWLGQPAALKTVNGALDAYKSKALQSRDAQGRLTQGAGEHLAAVDKVRTAMKGQVKDTGDVIAKNNAYAKSERLAQGALKGSKPPADAYSAAQRNVAAATKEAKEASDSLKHSLDEIQTAFAQGRATESDYEQALADATKALKKNGQGLDLHTQKGRDNDAAISAAVQSGLKYIKFLHDSKAPNAQLAAATADVEKNVRKLGRQAGLTGKALDTYVTKELGSIPTNVDIKIKADVKVAKANIELARQSVKKLGVDFDSLPPKVQTQIIQSGGKGVRDILRKIGIDVGGLNNTPAKVKSPAPGAIAARGQLQKLSVAAVTANGKIVHIPASSPKAAAVTKAILGIKGAQVATNGKRVDIPTSSLTARQTKALINGIHDAQRSADGKHVQIPTRALNVPNTIALINRLMNTGHDRTITIRTNMIQTHTTISRKYDYSGSPLHNATGGAIRGPGTGTSDSIPSLLSNGEHVWTAAEVAKAGGQQAMYALRAMVRSGGFRVPGYAGGGQVAAPPAWSMPAPRPTVVVRDSPASQARNYSLGDQRPITVQVMAAKGDTVDDLAGKMVGALRKIQRSGKYAGVM